MKSKIVLVTVGSSLFCLLFYAAVVAPTQPHFAFSIPLHAGQQEVLARLPPGRYALIVSTNSDSKTFGVIPPYRDYSSDVSLELWTNQEVLARERNMHYFVFSLSRADNRNVRFVLSVERSKEDSGLMMHIGRGF